MGAFRPLLTDLPCERCNTRRSVEVQFKTRSDWQEGYRVGQTVMAEDLLPRCTAWPAVVERFCEACFVDVRCDEEASRHEALARLVEQGRLRIASCGVDRSPSAADLRERGQRRAAELRRMPSGCWSSEGLTPFDSVCEGQPVHRDEIEAWARLAAEVNRLTADILRGRGGGRVPTG